MLNEMQEYHEYTGDLKNARIRDSFKNDLKDAKFSGISRVLEIIARHFLFDENGTFRGEEGINDAKDAMRLWMGSKHPTTSKNTEVQALNGWLPRLLEDLFKENPKQKQESDYEIGCLNNIQDQELINALRRFNDLSTEEQRENAKEAAKNALPNKEKTRDYVEWWYHKLIEKAYESTEQPKYKKSLLVYKTLTEKCSTYEVKISIDVKRNQCHFQGIIASAIDAGPLKRYYLCVNNFSAVKEIIQNIGIQENPKSKSLDFFYKVIAYYLLAKKSDAQMKVEGRTTVHIEKSSLINWSVYATKPKDYNLTTSDNKGKFDQINQNETNNFILSDLSTDGKNSDNTNALLEIRSELIQHFEIIEENELETWMENKQDIAFFRDDGWKSRLQSGEKKRYE